MNDDSEEMNGSEENGGEGGEDFAAMLEESLVATRPLTPGEKIEAKVLSISGEWVFLDVGQKGEGVVDRKEILDQDGSDRVTVGETLTVYFLSGRGGELRFTTRLGGTAERSELEEAYRAGIPVEGRLEKEIKGGYEVRLPGGGRAFCPFSQLGLTRGEDGAAAIGQSFSFRITQYGEGGRNIVLSRRALLEEERRRQREALRQTLAEGETVTGTISSVQDFGAFVDIGGLEGLIPISEVGWGRTEEIRAVLQPGQQVTVVVKALDWEKNRFAFSLREAQADPWQTVPARYPVGSSHRGRVVRLAPFGAFVELEPGIDGLLHISRLGEGRRINHPREVVAEGDDLEVQIESIDPQQRRLALVPAAAARAAREEAEAIADFRTRAKEGGMGTLGDLLQGKKSKKSRRK